MLSNRPFFPLEGEISSILASLLGFLPSLDHSIRPVKHGWWNRQADLLRGLKIYHQLELHRLLHGKVSRLGTLQDLVDISSGVSPFGNVTRAVGHHTSVVHIISPSTNRRQPIFCRKVCNRFLI